MMNRRLALPIVLVLAAALRPAVAAAQQSNLLTPAAANLQASPGWTVTPSLAYGGSWDDNVLVRGSGDVTPSDFLNTVNPRVALDFNGRRGQISANYDGAFTIYRDLDSLNSYDQRAWVYGRRLLSPHVALVARNQVASVPTTELAGFVGVPFLRTGSKLADLRVGIEAAFTKRTSITTNYNAQWIAFDQSAPEASSLRDGHSHGGSLSVKHVRTEQLAITADYDLQHAIIGSVGETFNIQNAWGGIEYKLTDLTRIVAAGGISRLGFTNSAQARTGPAWRLGLTRQIGTAGIQVFWSRSFVPAYGFGGTTQNEEITGQFNLPIGRRFYSHSALAWRSNDPLTVGPDALTIGVPLRSTWIQSSFGFMATRWAGIEMFYSGTHQTIDRPGGQLERRRVGFQVITAKPVRIR
jgi:hypothetical protein